jgi:hypothetical protein
MLQFTKVFLYSSKQNHDYQLSEYFCEDFYAGNK